MDTKVHCIQAMLANVGGIHITHEMPHSLEGCVQFVARLDWENSMSDGCGVCPRCKKNVAVLLDGVSIIWRCEDCDSSGYDDPPATCPSCSGDNFTTEPWELRFCCCTSCRQTFPITKADNPPP